MVRKIDMNAPHGPSRLTMMLVGASRSGKTHLAATWPRPVFLSDVSEGGYTTIQHMPEEDWYEPDWVPQVYGIESPKDMIEAMMEIKSLQARDKASVGTIVVDSLTMYAEMKFSELEVQAGSRPDKRRLYGDLGSHLRYIMIELHKIPVNVVWIALAKEGGEDHALGGLSIPGQTAVKAPARCDIWAYLDRDPKPGQGARTRLHTQNYGGFKAGHRFGDMLPPVIANPNYKSLEEHLNLAPWTERFTKAKPTRKKAAR